MLFHFYHSFLNLQLFPWDDQCTKLASHFVIFVNAADPLLFQYLITCWLWISPSAFKLVKFSTVLFRLLIKMKYLTFKCALCYTNSQSTSMFCVYIQAYTHLHIWTYTHVYLFLRYRVCITDSYYQLKWKAYFIVIVVQSLSHVWHFVTPWTAAGHTSLSFTIFHSLLRLMSPESVMPSNHLVLCHPLLLLPLTFLSIIVFSNELAKILELQHQCFQWIWRIDFL